MIVSSFCANLQTAALQKLHSIKVKKNKQVLQLCDLLTDLGYIAGYTGLTSGKLLIFLKYDNRRGPLRSLKISSRPSSRIYYGHSNLFGKRVNNYFRTNSFTIFSTPRGLLTDIECFMFRLGGEPVCVIS